MISLKAQGIAHFFDQWSGSARCLDCEWTIPMRKAKTSDENTVTREARAHVSATGHRVTVRTVHDAAYKPRSTS